MTTRRKKSEPAAKKIYLVHLHSSNDLAIARQMRELFDEGYREFSRYELNDGILAFFSKEKRDYAMGNRKMRQK